MRFYLVSKYMYLCTPSYPLLSMHSTGNSQNDRHAKPRSISHTSAT